MNEDEMKRGGDGIAGPDRRATRCAMSEALEDVQEVTDLVSYFMEMPSKLSAAAMKPLRAKAMETIRSADYLRGYFSGELSGCPDEEMKKYLIIGHPHYAQQVLDPLWTVLFELKQNALPPKRAKAGRPPKEPPLVDIGYVVVLAEFVAAKGARTLLDCIREVATTGLIDATVADTTHLRRITRLQDFHRKYAAASNVVLLENFRIPKPQKQ